MNHQPNALRPIRLIIAYLICAIPNVADTHILTPPIVAFAVLPKVFGAIAKWNPQPNLKKNTRTTGFAPRKTKAVKTAPAHCWLGLQKTPAPKTWMTAVATQRVALDLPRYGIQQPKLLFAPTATPLPTMAQIVAASTTHP